MLGEDAFLSKDSGPAVFGFWSPKIVLPKWVCCASPTEQRLVVLHEREHIRAGDQLQTLLGICSIIAMPWNPVLWLLRTRMRLAVESDCDRRVLAQEPNVITYAELLVAVGSKRRRAPLMSTLVGDDSELERRLRLLAKNALHPLWATALAGCAVMLMVAACDSRPTSPLITIRDGIGAKEKSANVIAAPARGALYTLSSQYPARAPQIENAEAVLDALRAAYIDGPTTEELLSDVTIRANVAGDGTRQFTLTRGGGNSTVDGAAMAAVRRLRFTPARTGDGIAIGGSIAITLHFEAYTVVMAQKADGSDAERR